MTYEEWAPYWPTSKDEPYASHINNTPKYVVSTTLDKVEWQNSTLIKDNLAGEITKLKQQPGKNIGVAGSGKRLFADGSALKRLRLVDSTTTRTGVIIARYQPYSQ